MDVPPPAAFPTAAAALALAVVAEGLSNVEIGEQLYIGAATVKTHVIRMLAKLATSMGTPAEPADKSPVSDVRS